MANDVVFTVEGKGKNLKKTAEDAGNIGKNVDKSNAALDKAGGKQDNYNRREKALYQTNLSSGKAYSKLAQNIGGGGSSSLVGAYATLAANVFALSAAFHALRSAAQFEQLVEGLNAVGDAAGRNLGNLGERLKNITDNAISAERAMRAVAVGTSAGFSATQLEKLTTVAKGASIALGRDMGDAMDRLVRGAAKLEPEILDELGIMVRLDEATENYASKLGKTASSLTQYERRQAFVNAINEQGLEKFEEIAASVEPVAYDQLAASLNNLSKSFLSIINYALGPLIDLLSNNQAALVGVIALFASTITRQMLPALHNMAGKARETAKQFAEMHPVITDNIVTTGKLPAAYGKIGKAMKEGTASVEEMAEGQRVLNNSQKWYQNMVDKGVEHPDYAKNLKGLNNVTKALGEHNKVMEGRVGVLARVQAADALTMANFGSLGDGWEKLNQSIKNNNIDIEANIEVGDEKAKKQAKWDKAAFKYGQRLKFIGATLVNSLPYIGLAITAFGILKEVWDAFVPGNKMKEASEEAIKAFERIDEINEKLLRNTARTNDELLIMKFQYKALGGVINTIGDAVGALGSAIFKEQSQALNTEIDNLLERQNTLEERQAAFNRSKGGGRGAAFSDLRVAKINMKEAERGTKKARDAYGKLNEEGVKAMHNMLARSIIIAKTTAKQTGIGGIGILDNMEKITFKVGQNISDAIQSVERGNTALNSFNNAIDTANQLVSNFVKARVALISKNTTPYDDVAESIHAIGDAIATVDQLAKVARITKEAYLPAMSGPGTSATVSETEEQARNRLEKLLIKELKLEQLLGITTRKQLENYIEKMDERADKMRKYKGQLEFLKRVEKDMAKLNKASFIGRASALKQANDALEQRRKLELEHLRTQRDSNIDLVAGLKKRADEAVKKASEEGLAQEEINKRVDHMLDLQKQLREATLANVSIAEQIVAKKDEEIDRDLELKQLAHAKLQDSMTLFKVQEEQWKMQKKTAALLETQARNEVALANLRDPTKRSMQDTDVNPSQQYALFLKLEKQKKDTIQKEWTMASTRIGLEFALLKAKTDMLVLESELLRDRIISEAEGDANKIQAATDTHSAYATAAQGYIDSQMALVTQRLILAGIERDTALSNLTLEKERLKVGAMRHGQEAFAAGSGSRTTGGGTGVAGVDFAAGIRASNKAYKEANEKALALRKKTEEQAAKDYDAGTLPGMGVFRDKGSAVSAAGDLAVKDAGLENINPSMSEKLGQMREMSQGLIDNLKQLGPGGEAAAAVAEGMFTVTQSFASAFEVLDSNATKMEKASAVLGAIGATLSAIGAMMKASSDARVAAIDKEIAAEQKRDGKSKASKAKLSALERKREAEARKGFERNKKMQMASAVISTASAVVGALAWDPKGWWNIPLAAMIGAMGAAQLALIASSSYDGQTAGVKQPSGIGSITMGERSNRVDTAGGRGNAAGELAYLRGARGTGSGAHDFRPAFAGRKYRAAGGAAYVVGEQGPELFVPSVPGQVVSNDDMEAGASAGNINFTINAIDAAGVEEVLVEQRGNIIGMIRESANEYGSDFLENVDTDAYTDITEGSVYGRA